MELGLNGKRALITGSTSGIGAAIAQVLAQEGVEVVIHGRNRDRAQAIAEQIQSSGAIAHVAIGDLSQDEGAESVITSIKAALGGVDILINNMGGNEAGSGALTGWFQDTPQVWQSALQQNLIAAVRMIHAFVPDMKTRQWGRVINIASGGASQPTTQAAAYCAAKAGILNLTVSLSMELARSGVTVNTVSPGCTRTRMFEGTLDKIGDAKGWPADLNEREKAFMDLGMFACSSTRYGRPEEVGTLVAFLSSPLAGFINGANYRIDGGQVQSIN